MSLFLHFKASRSLGCILIVGFLSVFLEVSVSVNELFKKLCAGAVTNLNGNFLLLFSISHNDQVN